MRSFFKIFFASFLSITVFSIIAILALIFIFSLLIAPDKPVIGSKGVLVIDLNEHFEEQSKENVLASLTGEGEGETPGLFDVVRLIRHAKKDEDIKGIYVKSDDNNNGFAASEEIRNALLDFKKTGKFVVSYGEVISQKAYYVASAADRVYCNPKGAVEWKGFASTLFFLKGTLEKLQIQPQIFYAGKFKSATEPLREYQMTEANRLQTSVYLNDLYSRLLLATTDRSKTDTGRLHQLANDGAIQTATDAARYHLIDDVKYDDQVKSEISGWLKIKETDKINFVSIAKYAKAIDINEGSGGRIAVIYAEGEIVDGKGEKGQISSDDFRMLIRKVRQDDNVKAIVFRVNSPGGSALASEIIWRELALAKKAKPVVVSFGDVAASGGYYISCNADSIFAQANTITGSIGVFGIIPNMGTFFKNKLGITFDGVKTGPFADMPNISRPLNDAEKKFVQNSIDTIYTVFRNRVAEGRKKPFAYIDSIAQGRVWTGERAVTIGLVDKIGSFQDAIDCAARMAKLKEFRIKEYPEKKGLLESLAGGYKKDVKMQVVKDEIGQEQFDILQKLKNIKQMVAIPQTRLPFDLQVQ